MIEVVIAGDESFEMKRAGARWTRTRPGEGQSRVQSSMPFHTDISTQRSRWSVPDEASMPSRMNV